MSEQKKPGMDRREFLRRAAVTTAAAAWAAPAVKTLASTPAFAQTATPKDFSYVAVCFTCNGQTLRVKFDLDDNGNPASCESGPNFTTPMCGLGCSPTASNGCEFASAYSPDGGQTVIVTLSGGCSFVDGVGVGKCGNPDNPQSGGECVTGVANGQTMTFSMCGA